MTVWVILLMTANTHCCQELCWEARHRNQENKLPAKVTVAEYSHLPDQRNPL